MTYRKKVTVRSAQTVTTGLQVTDGYSLSKSNCNRAISCFLYLITSLVTQLQLNKGKQVNREKGVNRAYMAVYGSVAIPINDRGLTPLLTVTCNLLRFGGVSHA